MHYLKMIIKMVSEEGNERRVWVRPDTAVAHIGAYVDDAAACVRRLEAAGLAARLRRGNKAALVTVTPETFQDHKGALAEFIRDAFGEEDEAA